MPRAALGWRSGGVLSVPPSKGQPSLLWLGQKPEGRLP